MLLHFRPRRNGTVAVLRGSIRITTYTHSKGSPQPIKPREGRALQEEERQGIEAYRHHIKPF